MRVLLETLAACSEFSSIRMRAGEKTVRPTLASLGWSAMAHACSICPGPHVAQQGVPLVLLPRSLSSRSSSVRYAGSQIPYRQDHYERGQGGSPGSSTTWFRLLTGAAGHGPPPAHPPVHTARRYQNGPEQPRWRHRHHLAARVADRQGPLPHSCAASQTANTSFTRRRWSTWRSRSVTAASRMRFSCECRPPPEDDPTQCSRLLVGSGALTGSAGTTRRTRFGSSTVSASPVSRSARVLVTHSLSRLPNLPADARRQRDQQPSRRGRRRSHQD